MNKTLETRLNSVSLPTPPGVAQEIIALANDPDVSMTVLAETIVRDAGTAMKIMKMANSALYIRRRRSVNIREALTVMGFKATTTLALSFSLAPLFNQKTTSLDYSNIWRRALVSAVAARSLGELVGVNRAEDLFLAALLQDVGIIALDRGIKDFYAELSANASHEDLCAYETKSLGEDHARVGAHLLNVWNLPGFLVEAVGSSHVISDPASLSVDTARFNQCAALSGHIAETLLLAPREEQLSGLKSHLATAISASPENVASMLAQIAQVLPEFEHLFDTHLVDQRDIQSLLDQARDLLAARSIESMEVISALKVKAVELEEQASALKEDSQRDALTGVYNRRHLESVLSIEFSKALATGELLSLIFVDLDHFKRINDTYGHPAGDTVLRAVAHSLLSLVRTEDFVARFGGEEFVIVLPGLSETAALGLSERILEKLRSTPLEIAHRPVRVTASIGIAAHDGKDRFRRVEDLVKAADAALYQAKHGGRDRWACDGVYYAEYKSVSSGGTDL